MMNETYKGFFQSTRGLRQGDQLSSYLFIMIEEMISRLLKKQFELGKIGRFFHLMGAPLVSHLLYVDDLLVFYIGEKITMKMVMRTLEKY